MVSPERAPEGVGLVRDNLSELASLSFKMRLKSGNLTRAICNEFHIGDEPGDTTVDVTCRYGASLVRYMIRVDETSYYLWAIAADTDNDVAAKIPESQDPLEKRNVYDFCDFIDGLCRMSKVEILRSTPPEKYDPAN